MKKANKYCTPYQYANLCGVSTQAIYQRIKLGKVSTVDIPDISGVTKRYIDLKKFPPRKGRE